MTKASSRAEAQRGRTRGHLAVTLAALLSVVGLGSFAYATFAGVDADKFRYLSGEDDLKTYASSSDHERVFCGNCGSNILASVDGYPDSLFLSMGAIEGNPALPEAYHIYVGSKAQWHEISDNLVQHDEDEPE